MASIVQDSRDLALTDSAIPEIDMTQTDRKNVPRNDLEDKIKELLSDETLTTAELCGVPLRTERRIPATKDVGEALRRHRLARQKASSSR